ncbi:1,4-dihydroxy-2-naphthoate polyprenyltransferase [Cyclobacteriaceae bacterium YHN15]|nr:1,4-dihydroxy-2-naphthoate polyprenyltransferase [Cyclobacteriaceae bacterium YHN15]
MDIIISNKKQAWLHAIRLRTLPLALSSILMGSILAAYGNNFRWPVFILAALTTIFLQVLSNLSNDYGDSIHGADSDERKGPVRAVQSGMISLTEMKTAMILLTGFSLFSGLTLLYFSFQDWKLFALFLGFGIMAIWAAITYTSGDKPYGYVGLGDISVFLFFGLLGVVGTYFLHSLDITLTVFWPAISLGCFSTAVLNINNIRDIESDKKAGKKSIPVRIGRKKAIHYNWALIITGNMALLIFAIANGAYGSLIALLAFPLMMVIGKSIQAKQESHELDPYLKKMALSTLMWVILFGFGLLFF